MKTQVQNLDTAMLGVYCERAGSADQWAEPLNALTNLAFLVAAVAVGWRLQRTPGLSWRNGWDLWLLTGLLAAIGIGSGLWHSFATSWGLFAVSSAFRTLDAAVCSLVPLGTHFLWHLLNALVLFLLLDSLRQRGRYASVAR